MRHTSIVFAAALACGCASNTPSFAPPDQATASAQPSGAPGHVFSEPLAGGGSGPEMVVIPLGAFLMGSPDDDARREANEGPQRRVVIASAFAVGRTEVTWDEWEACVAAGACESTIQEEEGGDEGGGRGARPVVNVSWRDTRDFVDWLNAETEAGQYRLLTEAEWEYVARAGSEARFSWGDDDPVCDVGADNGASFGGCGEEASRPVASFQPNAFGVYDMHGNVWEWVEDCYVDNYADAPGDGSAVLTDDCRMRVNRGGAWFSGRAPFNSVDNLRAAYRSWRRADLRGGLIGFRVARDLE